MGIRPRKAAVIGWPVWHSRSPAIFRHWLDRHGIEGSYERIAVPPDGIDAFLDGFAASGLVGANVTVPHKEAAFRHAVPDAAARAIGAVNTLWLEDGVLHGTNSDGDGFLRNLDEQAPGWSVGGRGALVIGAGGAARAIVHGLASRGVRPIAIANRTPERAGLLAAAFPTVAEAVAWDAIPREVARAGLVVNTTVLGMAGSPALDVDLSGAGPATVVADIVYVPLETPLLASARARGLRTVDGLGMLLHQAAVGFEKWFGLRPAVDAALREAILAEIGTRA